MVCPNCGVETPVPNTLCKQCVASLSSWKPDEPAVAPAAPVRARRGASPMLVLALIAVALGTFGALHYRHESQERAMVVNRAIDTIYMRTHRNMQDGIAITRELAIMKQEYSRYPVEIRYDGPDHVFVSFQVAGQPPVKQELRRYSLNVWGPPIPSAPHQAWLAHRNMRLGYPPPTERR